MIRHREHCPLMGCTGCAPELGAQPLVGAATVPTELDNTAVAVGADMARAVLAAEHYRQTGALPAWATDREDLRPCLCSTDS